MKQIQNAEGEMVALDHQHEFDLEWVYGQIKLWKKYYLKKNSKRAVEIYTRFLFLDDDIRYWKFWIELKVANKIVEKHRIRHEAFDIITRGFPIIKESASTQIVYIEKFIPQP